MANAPTSPLRRLVGRPALAQGRLFAALRTSGLAFLYGYLCSALQRDDRVEDERFRRFVSAELRNESIR